MAFNNKNIKQSNINKDIKKPSKREAFPILEYKDLIKANSNWATYLDDMLRDPDRTYLPKNNNFDINSPRIALYDLIGIERNTLIERYIKNDPKYIINAKESPIVDALIYRIDKLRLRLGFVYFFLNAKGENQPALKRKYQDLITRLRRTTIILNFTQTPAPNLPPLSFKTTIDKLKRELRIVEQILREFLSPFLDILRITANIKDLERHPRILDMITRIAPSNQIYIQPDYHYFWALYGMGNYVYGDPTNKDAILFVEEAHKNQWYSYREEISYLLNFFLIDENPINVEILMQNPSEDGHLINKPFKTFISERCSKNTYAAFINVANIIVPKIYLGVMDHLIHNFSHIASNNK